MEGSDGVLRIGIIGCSGIGLIHGEAYKYIDNAEVVAVADIVREKADYLGKLLGAETYYNGRELLQRDDIDVVDICLPTYLHEEFVLEAAERGFHILCEKPMTLSMKKGQNMIDACEKAGVKLMIGQVLRYYPDYLKGIELMSNGTIENVRIVRAYRGGPHPARNRGWYEDSSKSGGPIIDMAIDEIDYLIHCFGAVKEVYAKVSSRNLKLHENAMIMLEFEKGQLAHIMADWSRPRNTAFNTRLEIIATKGIARFNLREEEALELIEVYKAVDNEDVEPPSPMTIFHSSSNPYVREINEFLLAVETGRKVSIPPI